MGFVSERLTRHLRAIDFVFHLDPDHCDLSQTFSALFANEEAFVVQSPDDAALLLWEALQSPLFNPKCPRKQDDGELAEDRLPPLNNVARILQEVHKALYEQEISPDGAANASSVAEPHTIPRYPLPELAFLAKVIAVLQAHLVHKLLVASTSLPPDIAYWRDQEISVVKSAYYLLQSLPQRIYKYTKSFLASIRAQQATHLRPEFRVFSKKLLERFEKTWDRRRFSSATFLGLGTTWLKSPPTIFELARHEIRLKREKLETVREIQAGCLGLLAVQGIGIDHRGVQITFHNVDASVRRTVMGADVEDAAKDVQSALSRSVALMFGVMDRVGKATRGLSPDEEISHSDLTSLEDQALSSPIQAISSLYRQTQHMYELLIRLDASFERLIYKYGRPSAAVRYWAPTVTGAIVAYILGSTLAVRWDDVVNWIEDLQDTAKSFLTEWILKPLKNIYTTVRHKEARLAITSNESLNADLESLERMVVEYAKDHGITDSLELSRIAHQAHNGDLSPVLTHYTAEIKSPLKNALKGDLIRGLLIQIQKAKVDGELAISALDKLLRSNELNFAFLAVMPSLLLTWLIGRELTTMLKGGKEKTREKTYELVRDSLRNIDRILNRSNHPRVPVPPLPYKAHGLLLCEVYLLRKYVPIVPRKENFRHRFVEDLRELESGYQDDQWTNLSGTARENVPDETWTVPQRMETVKRMWRTYPFVRGPI